MAERRAWLTEKRLQVAIASQQFGVFWSFRIEFTSFEAGSAGGTTRGENGGKAFGKAERRIHLLLLYPLIRHDGFGKNMATPKQIDKFKIVVVNRPMSAEERRHIEAIARQPNDDELRLAYARWLATKDDASEEEIGKSKFIDVQCRLALLQQANDLSPAATREYARLAEEERSLRQRFAEEWTAHLRTELPSVHDVVFRRGLPDALVVDAAQFPEDAARLFETVPTVRGLALCAPERFRDKQALTRRILALPALKQLDRLSFSGNWGDQTARILADAPASRPSDQP